MKDEMDFLAFGKHGPEATPQEAADLDHWARGTADLFSKIRSLKPNEASYKNCADRKG
jgi:hypothetical protein